MKSCDANVVVFHDGGESLWLNVSVTVPPLV